MNKQLKRSELVSLATGLERPSREEAETAVRTLIRWAGDNPDREGLLGTPDRVVLAYEEFFSGYDDDPREMLRRTFEEVEGYDEIVVLRDIRLESHCEHHMVPIIGKVHIGYLPDKRVVGISKLARVVDAFAHRLQIQEKLTAQIANTLQEVLQPRGVAVGIAAAPPPVMAPRRGAQVGRRHGDQPHAGRVPRQRRDPPRVFDHDRQDICLIEQGASWQERSSAQWKCCAVSWRSTPPRAIPTWR